LRWVGDLRDVLPVERWRDGEEVRERLVAVGFVEVEGIAGEDELADQGGGATDLVGVAHSLRAVKDGCCRSILAVSSLLDGGCIGRTVQHVGDVFESLGPCGEGG